MHDDIHLQNYGRVRDRVLAMLADDRMRARVPSEYWKQEIEGFDYLLDASPAVVRKLRHHCHHLTGVRPYEYRPHHAHTAGLFQAKLAALRHHDPVGLFVPEPNLLGGFGHDIDGTLVNLDTLKFYESLIAISRAGLLDGLATRRCVVVEIGAGWGGFAYQLKTILPNTTYVVIDLPHAILIAATYLLGAFPGAKVFIYGDEDEPLTEDITQFDFVFIPHFAFDAIALPSVDLGINMISFQEMTDAQIVSYLDRLKQLGCGYFYSHNRDRSPHNRELSSVEAILRRYYRITTVDVLPVQYTDIALPPRLNDLWPRTLHPVRAARHVVKQLVGFTRHMLVRDPLRYKHIVGIAR